MSANAAILATLILLTAGIILWTLRQPTAGTTLGGRALIFVGFCALPLLLLAGGMSHHMEQAKTTDFCLSCHIMEPYGESLRIDHGRFIPAVHFQNKQIPREQACYSCHTNYTMFGGLEAKFRGAKHVWHNILGTAADPIKLYEPYSNRECLHCHAGARSYESHPEHTRVKAEMASGARSCLMCHNLVHEADKLDRYELWTAEVTP